MILMKKMKLDSIFKLASDYKPAGDQPKAIRELNAGLDNEERDQVLLGVTGSGKTFTMAKIIEAQERPTLILAPNKTLAAQLYSEMKEFFPSNAIEYFVSYYDYYQPEAYVARTDTYIEKESSINEQINRMRHSATRMLLERRDVIVVASVSCIYGIGDVEDYSAMTLVLKQGQDIDQQSLMRHFVDLQYKRNDIGFSRGCFRVTGDTVDIFPSHMEDRAWRLSFFGDEIEGIIEIDPLTGHKTQNFNEVKIYANSHHVIPKPTMQQALKQIKIDLKERISEFEASDKLIEAQRINQRVTFDIEMMTATGMCPGIENYSRYFTGREPGEAPPTLFEYLPKDALIFLDESHVGIPQLNGMYKGDAARKRNLSDFGFRLPACKDNRPLKFEEWEILRPQTIYVSATPGPWELEKTQGVFTEQVIRPTGLVDPPCLIRPTENQVDDLIHECLGTIEKGLRILVTTLTKKMAEALTQYFDEAGIKVSYIHSDVDTLERIEIIRELRLGTYDVLIGINLLREGLDIPECGLVAILDADKEGYLRSRTSLIQTIGRAARNMDGKAILYADRITGSMQAALDENNRRREKQQAYNVANGITPETVKKSIRDIIGSMERGTLKSSSKKLKVSLQGAEFTKHIKSLRKQMNEAASNLEFEEATCLRDEIHQLEKDQWKCNELSDFSC